MPDELFEKMDKATLVNSQGLTYKGIRKTLEPRFGLAWFHIFLGWVGLAALFVLLVRLSGIHLLLDIFLVLGGAFLLGFTIAYLQLFLHEAAHYNLHPNRTLNDLLTNLFVSGMVGIEVKNYRPIHWDHHRFHGTTMDTEISYYDTLNIRFVAEIMLGIRVLRVISIRKERLKNTTDEEKKEAGMQNRPYTLLGGLIFNALLIGSLLYLHHWVTAIAWFVAVLVVYPFFGAFRQLLEHRDENANPNAVYTEVAHGAVHRLFGDGLIASTMGGAGFNRHLLHHWDPQVSYTRLRELETFLMDTPAAQYLQERQTTYLKTLGKLFSFSWGG